MGGENEGQRVGGRRERGRESGWEERTREGERERCNGDNMCAWAVH